MATKNFFLVGKEHDSRVSIDVSALESFHDLQHEIASAFSVAETKTISFHTSLGSLTTLDVILASTSSIGIKVDSMPIRNPSGPSELPFVGNHFEIYPDHMGNHDRLFSLYGSVIKTVNMGTTIYLTNDPRASEVILGENEFFTKRTSDPSHPLYHMKDQTALFMCDSNAPAFKVAHKFIPPSMSPKAIKRYTPAMQYAVEQSFDVFDALDEKQQAFHVYQYMFKLAGQIIYRVILGLDVGHFTDIDTRPHQIIHLLGEYMVLMKKTSLSPPWHRYLPFGNVKRLEHVRAMAWRLVDNAINDCESGGSKDLPIQEVALESTCIADYLKRAVDENGEKLPHELMLTNVVVLIGAGFVTSASLLSWLVFSLTQYPQNQNRLLQELVNSGATSTTHWTYDQITSMPFLDHFVKECHRMHNPSFQTARNAKKDVIIPGGYLIPAGSIVIPTFPSIHKHKDYWENPERFDPDRWAGVQATKERHRMAFTPFAAGPRGCVGYNVAQLEAKLALANLVYRYKFVDASKDPMAYDPEFLVIRPLNFYARALRRTSWPESERK